MSDRMPNRPPASRPQSSDGALSIQFDCPTCGEHLSVRRTAPHGQRIRCPTCEHVFRLDPQPRPSSFPMRKMLRRTLWRPQLLVLVGLGLALALAVWLTRPAAESPRNCSALVPRPTSGVQFGKPTRRGRGELTVFNGTAFDAVAVLINPGQAQPKRAMYVRRGELARLPGISADSYQLLFQLGDEWLETRQFCRPQHTARFDELLTFDEIRTEDRVNYRTISVTLNPMPDGTALTTDLPNAPLLLPPE